MSGATIVLEKAIQAHDKDLTELVLREPTVKDTMELGQPFLIIVGDGDTGIRIQQKVVGQYIVRLAGIPMSSVHSLTLQDFSKAQAAVLGFFGAGDAEQSSS
jgi:hypothetical protein